MIMEQRDLLELVTLDPAIFPVAGLKNCNFMLTDTVFLSVLPFMPSLRGGRIGRTRFPGFTWLW